MANLIDAQNQVNIQRETTLAVVDLKNSLSELFKEAYKVLVQNNEISSSSLEEQTNENEQKNNVIQELTNNTKDMVEQNSENNNALNDLVNQQNLLVNKPDKEQEKTRSLLSRIGGNLKDYAKASIKQKFENSKLGKFVGFIKNMTKDKKKDDKEKPAVTPLAKPEKPGKPNGLDSNIIGGQMANTMAKTLTPGALVGAFLAKVLPLIIIFGLLLFLFLTSFFDMDVSTAIWTTLGIIVTIVIALVIAYIAFKYVQAILVTTIQIMCEMIKLALAAGANAVLIFAIMAVMMAFIIIAPLILIAIVAIFALLVVAIVGVVWIIAELIIKILEIVAQVVIDLAMMPVKILEALGKLFTSIFSGKKSDSDEAAEKAADKLTRNQLLLHNLIRTTLSNFIKGLSAALAMFGIFVNSDDTENAFTKALAPIRSAVDSIASSIGISSTNTVQSSASPNNPFANMIAPLVDPINEFRKSFEEYAKEITSRSSTIIASSAPSSNTSVSNSDFSYPTETNNTNNTEISSVSESTAAGMSEDVKNAIIEIAKYIKRIDSNGEKTVSLLSKKDSSFFGFSL